jgi:hypothetical protein
MYSDFYGRTRGREYFGVEVIANHIGKSVLRAEADFRAHVTANGLFHGDLKLEGSQFLENAYPIYSDGADEKRCPGHSGAEGVRDRISGTARRLQLSADRARLDA